MHKSIVAYGEALWDVLPAGMKLGGAPLNFAFRAHSLGERVRMVSRLGDDELGRLAHERICALGIDASAIQWDVAHPTGTVNIDVRADGAVDIDIVPDVAWDYIQCTERDAAEVSACDCVCFGSVAQRSPGSRRAFAQLLKSASDAVRFCDVNLRRGCYSAETVALLLAQCDVLKLNEEEAQVLGEMFALGASNLFDLSDLLRARWHIDAVVITLGPRGALAASDVERVYDAGYAVDVIDTLGAGDAFSAGFAYHYLRGQALRTGVQFGNVLGAIVSGQAGATGEITRQQIEAMTGGDHERVIDAGYVG